MPGQEIAGSIFGPFSVCLINTLYGREPFVITLSTSTSAWTNGCQETTHGGIIDLCIGPASSFVKGAVVGRGDFLRVYEPDRKVFTFRGAEFNIQEIAMGVDNIYGAMVQRMQRLELEATQHSA